MGTTPLEGTIREIEALVESPHARCVIVDEGFSDESTLMGTRDGYLNLALCLLRFVADVEANRCDTEEGHPWDDRIKAALYQRPIRNAWIVGAHLFGSHAEYMAELSRLVDPRLEHPLLNDPSFAEPTGGETAGPADLAQPRAAADPTGGGDPLAAALGKCDAGL